MIAPILARRDAAGFWLAVVLTGAGTGLGAAALTGLLLLVQHTLWYGSGVDILAAASRAPWWWHIAVLLAAGVLTAAGQLLLVRLSSANGIDITAAIWFHAGRLPAVRTLGSAVLSVLIVGMGASLGREGAPKQAGAVIANLLSDRTHLSDEMRRLLVACGAGAGMAAAYGVPLGGALFALEVLRGALALRFVLPCAGHVAGGDRHLVGVSAGCGRPTLFPPMPARSGEHRLGAAGWAGDWPGSPPWPMSDRRGLGRIATGRKVGCRVVAPVRRVLGLAGRGLHRRSRNCSATDATLHELAFAGQLAPLLMLGLVLLKPAATLLCLGSGAPGGLFTPSLALGALLGGALGAPMAALWPGAPAGLYAVLGAGAVLAATTQGPISTIVLMMELTGHARSFIVPLLLVVAVATLTARTVEPRSIYDARLSDDEVLKRQRQRDSGG